MHELGRVMRVISDSLGKAKGKKVARVQVKVRSPGLDEEEFKSLFEANTKNTPLEGARVELVKGKQGYTCKACKKSEEGLPLVPIRCNYCGNPDITKKPDFEIMELETLKPPERRPPK
jgi:Zn finger protein HypA/HybF involved in hydrogenase expression